MKLDDNEAKTFLAWLNEHWKGDHKCPICQNDTWQINSTVFELRSFESGNLVAGAPIYPVVCVTCDTCGHSLFFNAIRAGLISGTDRKTRVREVNKDAS
ncbi:MAG: hypothetical protein GXY55_14340 [Phycisphaerae bacterium]|nr:hypothetical protein [Phycisphaerae bacterium]